jgi:hypothetical protein
MTGHVEFGMLDILNNLHEYIHQNLLMLSLVSSLKRVYFICMGNAYIYLFQPHGVDVRKEW